MTVKTTKKSAVKGTVAAAAGVAVLLGGMGTFALWNGKADITSSSITTGTLTVTPGTAPLAWQDVTDDTADAKDITLDTFRMVPGDELVGTTKITVTATGDNLKIKPTLSGVPASQVEDVAIGSTFTDESGKAVDGELSAGTHVLTATITVDYTATDETQNAGQGKTINLSGLAVDVEQVTSGS